MNDSVFFTIFESKISRSAFVDRANQFGVRDFFFFGLQREFCFTLSICLFALKVRRL